MPLHFPTPPTVEPLPSTVYPPSEDSYLLLDLLPLDAPFLSTHFPPTSPTPFIVELGPGSGIVTSLLVRYGAEIFSRPDLLISGIDASPVAAKCTRDTIALAFTEPEASSSSLAAFTPPIIGDTLSALKPRSLDVLVFNPPYVPSEDVPSVHPARPDADPEKDRDEEDRLYRLTYDGGLDGMETTWKVLRQLEEVMSERGVAYVLFCAQNKPAEVEEWVKREMPGWGWHKVGGSGKKAGWERLGVWRIWRTQGEAN